MKEIKILYLFPHLLSLYGEYGNVKTLQKELIANGFDAKVVEYEGDGKDECDISDLMQFDFIYLGSGVERNVTVAVDRLDKLKESFKEYIDSGKCILATGNAMAIFGNGIAVGDSESKGLEIFGYSCKMLTERRFFGDVLTDENNIFSAPLIGVVNTPAIYSDITTPLAKNLYGASLGNDKASAAEGFVSGGFIGTQLIGPFLVKNPPALIKICEMITGETLPLDMTTMRGQAYRRISSALRGKLEEKKA